MHINCLILFNLLILLGCRDDTHVETMEVFAHGDHIKATQRVQDHPFLSIVSWGEWKLSTT